MDKAYDHKKFEDKIYKLWEESGAFRAKETGEPYTVLMPPPNANASLHAGHAMYTIDDIMTRIKRMQGYSTSWIPGTDHAGFETQYVYEKYLAKQGKSRMDFDSKTLYKDIYNFVKDNSGLIFQQFKALGFSADWERSTFTLDPRVLDQVFETFKRMERESMVYRAEYLVNYCVNCGTSLAELEVEHTERTDALYYIDYPTESNPNEIITVATVRPETMFGDTAIAVNPKDKRYTGWAGKLVKLPLTKRLIPIIEDEMVEMGFGTGAVKITPAHDPADWESGKRHQLPIIQVIDMRGRMKMPADSLMPELEGVKVKEAREKTIERLQQNGYLNKVQSDYLHAVTTCYRCHRDLEPMIVPNWFIRVEEFKKPAIAAITKDEVKFTPRRYKKQIMDWLELMHDWPISRQIVWGIRIPVWYEVNREKDNIWVTWLDHDNKLQLNTVNYFLNKGTPLSDIEAGLQKVYALTGKDQPGYIVAKEKPEDKKMYIPETDTFDTWFSSGQWPLVTLMKEEIETRLPTDFMGTLSDILKFWISRMIMFSLYIENKVPFKDVYLWSMVADVKGVKMSKSKGNVVNPIELVDRYGADALRMTLVYGVAQGGKIPLSEEKVKGMRNFANKIWNMGRFIKIMFEEYGKDVPYFEESMTDKLQIEDKEILNILNETIKKAGKAFEKFRFADAADIIYEFMWHQLADVYIEQIKQRKQQEIALSIARYTYINGLKLLHPIMPFVTEAIWQELRKEPNMGIFEEKLITAKWPEV